MGRLGDGAPAPCLADFSAIYDRGDAQLVFLRVAGDLDTPVSAYLKLAGSSEDSFLLESVEGGEQLGRYSTIGLDPDWIWRAQGDAAELNRHAQQDPDAFVPHGDDPVTSLKSVIAESQIPSSAADLENLPPMAAGVFGYFGYDFVRLTENLPNRPPSDYNAPDGYYVRPTILAIFDNITREVILVSPARPAENVSAEAAYSAACERLKEAAAKLAAALTPPSIEPTAAPEFTANLDQTQYEGMVHQAKEYIAAGDIFQVVLSQRFSADYEGEAFQIYRELRRVNPSPFLFYLNFRPATLLGASPEILVRVRNNQVTIRPIAGTRPRGGTPAEDATLAEELLADPKECAEHLMLLDLGRNDVGRSSKIGTVRPTETFTIERYSHVMHIVSNVTGELREDIHPLTALANGFPAGTLTGAPKVRAMEIIDELEPSGRGPYGGCIGYFGTDGAVDSCIGLRMAVVADGKVHVQAGAGIVADSDATSEYNECLAKAAAMKHAIVRATRA